MSGSYAPFTLPVGSLLMEVFVHREDGSGSRLITT